MEFIFIPLLACIILMIGEHSNPRGMNIFWYKLDNIALHNIYMYIYTMKHSNQIAIEA